jgi:HlyD family secretion protein
MATSLTAPRIRQFFGVTGRATWLAAACATATAGSGSAAEQPMVPVVVAPVTVADQATGQSFVGTVRPSRVSDVGSAVDGRVVDFLILDGQHVREGEPLAELLRGLLEIDRGAAVAECERLRQVLAELRAGSRPEEIEQAQAVVAALEARLAYARARLARLGRLAERGTSTADELQVAQAEMQQLEAQFRGGRAALHLVEAGPRAEQIAQAAAAVAAQEAAVERIDDQLAKHTIRAPFAGWVIERFTEKGQWIARGGLVARIAQLDEVQVEVRVPEISVGGLAVGVDVRLEFDAAPHHTWIGRVVRIVPQADVQSRSFPVQIALANSIVEGVPMLRGGMLARVWLPVGRAESVTVVPKDALVLGGPTPVVFVIDAPGAAAAGASGVVRAVPVELGAAVGGNVEVRSELAPGRLVVVRGNERLRPGTPVAFEQPRNELSSPRTSPP